MATITRNYLGSATLNETCGTLTAAQGDETAQLTGLEAVINEKEDGSEIKINIATYEEADILDILDDLKCFDVSTSQGAADAAAAQHDHKPIWSGKIWVQDNLTDVEILGRTTP